jgi:acyl-CoA synthetase (AMP-forming)/AMP-acid ligase II
LAVNVQRDAFTELTGMTTVDTPLFLGAAGAGANPYARALVDFIESIPKSPSGKILRRELRHVDRT